MLPKQPLTFILIHSPFLGPYSWSLVAHELQQRGYVAHVPALPAQKQSPYWQHDAMPAADAIRKQPAGTAIFLAGHSGGGMLLPAIRQLAARPVTGYIFADAGIPLHGKSRLDLLNMELPEAGAAVAEALQHGESFPQWADEDVRDTIPDDQIRKPMMAEFNPQPLAFFTEPIPVFAGWPDAPYAYLQFSSGYSYSAQQAQQLGWPHHDLQSSHFALLTEPQRVADELIGLTASMLKP